MLFNTPAFALFFAIVFTLYWVAGTGRMRLQNAILLIASYFFYCQWDWRFGFLLAFSTLLDYYSALAIAHSEKHKRIWLTISITINLGFLAFFKYCNFFIDSAARVIEHLGFTPHISTLNIILPVGISFYTFHGLSYVIDTYNSRITPTRNIINYSLFVSFFPLLVAGPIERATHLLPQIEKPRSFNYNNAVLGLRQILWGLVKKCVIADNCAYFANSIFNDYGQLNGSALAMGAFFFAFQIYGDFSGYTDMAAGVSRLMGFEVLKNFSYPYFSRNIAEFWRRWHISLTTWFKDYLYIPLGGSRGSKLQTVRNTFIIFLVSGFWHGANLTFIFWGLFHALLFIPLLLSNTNRKYTATVAEDKKLPPIKEFTGMLATFFMVTIGWIFFRSPTITDSFAYLKRMFSRTLFGMPNISLYDRAYAVTLLILLLIFTAFEWTGRQDNFAIETTASKWPKPLRWVFYTLLVFTVILFMRLAKEPFIYFQF